MTLIRNINTGEVYPYNEMLVKRGDFVDVEPAFAKTEKATKATTTTKTEKATKATTTTKTEKVTKTPAEEPTPGGEFSQSVPGDPDMLSVGDIE